MLVDILNVLAIVMTVSRSWPQFVRIVVKKDHQGVSLLTWCLTLISFSSWLSFAVLANMTVLIIVNATAGLGAAGVVRVMSNWKTLFACVVGSVVASSVMYAIDQQVLEVWIVGVAVASMVPQRMKVMRVNPHGVSVSTWTLSAISSATWIVWGFAVNHPMLIAAHYLMLPAALAIVARCLLNGRSSAVNAVNQPA